MARVSGGAQGRAQQVAEAALPILAAAGAGPWLVANDETGRITDALGATPWSRWYRGAQAGTLAPPAGPCAQAALRIPKDRDGLAYAAHQLAARLPAGGHLWVYGHNDEGIKSAGKRLVGPLFATADTIASRRHCRIWRLVRTDAPAAPGLDPWWTQRAVPVAGAPRPWWSLPGLFAKGGLDAATALLLDSVAAHPPAGPAVLDFAAGTGLIAASLAAAWPGATLTATDADALAVEATRRNAPEVEAVGGDAWSALAGRRFDCVVSNPPIHDGKAEDFSALRQLITEAPQHLTPGGELWLVAQKQVPVQALLDQVFGQVKLHADDPRFRVWRARLTQERT